MNKLTSHQQRALQKRKTLGDRSVKADINRKETKRVEAAIAAADAAGLGGTGMGASCLTELDPCWGELP